MPRKLFQGSLSLVAIKERGNKIYKHILFLKWQEKYLNQILESLGQDNVIVKKSFIYDIALKMTLEMHILLTQKFNDKLFQKE